MTFSHYIILFILHLSPFFPTVPTFCSFPLFYYLFPSFPPLFSFHSSYILFLPPSIPICISLIAISSFIFYLPYFFILLWLISYIASSAPIPIPIATSFTKKDESDDESDDTGTSNSELDLSPAMIEPKQRKVKVRVSGRALALCFLMYFFCRNLFHHMN